MTATYTFDVFSSSEESEVPLCSHGSLSLNRALMAAGLVDRVQVTLFPTDPPSIDPEVQADVEKP
jgi:hypothetical protein